MKKLDLNLICQSFYHSKDNHPFGQGGTDSQIYGLADALGQMGHDVNILGNFVGDNWKESWVKEDNINFCNISSAYLGDKSIGTPISLLLLSKKYASYLETLSTDFLLLMARDSAYYPSKLDIPKIYITHNPDGMYFYKDCLIRNNPLNRVYFYYRNFVEERVMARTNAIVSLNKYISDYLKKRNFDNINIIPNAVDPKLYKNKGDKGYILYAGGLRGVKGVEYLIRAFNLIKDKYDVDLVIIGSGPNGKKLKSMKIVSELGNRITFIPLLDKLQYIKYLSKCTVFVLPSLYETFGIVVIEAMASSKPVIASNIPGPQDVITHGTNGFLFPEKDVKALSHYLSLFLEDDSIRLEIGKQSRKTVVNNYSFDVIANEYSKLFEKIEK